jgi:hypothetical protein
MRTVTPVSPTARGWRVPAGRLPRTLSALLVAGDQDRSAYRGRGAVRTSGPSTVDTAVFTVGI